MRPPRLHLAILTYNALPHTEACLRALRQHTREPFAVTVWDNGSTDGTPAFLQRLDDPRVHVHLSAENRGVPGGRNELLQRVLPRLPDDGFCVFLDNDIEVAAGWELPFLRLFAARSDCGLASRIGWSMTVTADGREPVLTPRHTARVDICAGGYACFVRKAAALAVGPFDEQLGLFWHEDDDYAVRMAAAGYTVFAVPEAPMTHHEHASGVGTTLADPRSQKNLAYLARKWRALERVDDDGWVRSDDASWYVAPAVRQRLHQRLGRRAGRAEWTQALWDRARLRQCAAAGEPFPRPLSPLLDLLLTEPLDAFAPADRAFVRAAARAPLPALAATGERCAADLGDDWFATTRAGWATAASRRALAEAGAAVPLVRSAGALVHGDEPRFVATLQQLRRQLPPDGHAALAVDVGAELRNAPDEAAVRRAVRDHGLSLERWLSPDLGGAEPREAGDDRWPDLLLATAGGLATAAVLLVRRRAAAPRRVEPAPLAGPPVEIDLRGLPATPALDPRSALAVQVLTELATGSQASCPQTMWHVLTADSPHPSLWPLLAAAAITLRPPPAPAPRVALLPPPDERRAADLALVWPLAAAPVADSWLSVHEHGADARRLAQRVRDHLAALAQPVG